ncbi:hypothetical protein ACLOJK_029522 [Asimina triloba]
MAWIICCSGSGRIQCCQSVDHCLMVSDDGSVKLKMLVFGAARGLASLEPMLAPGGWTTLAVRSGFSFFGSEVGRVYGMLMDADRCCGRWLICFMHSKGAGRTECLVVLLEWMVASDAVVHDGGLDRTLLPTIWTVSRIWRRWGLLSLCPDRIFRLGLAGDGFHGSLVEEDGAPYYGAPRIFDLLLDRIVNSLLGTVGGRMITGSSADADSGPLKDAMAWIICCSGSGRIQCCQSVDHCLMVSDDGSVKLKTLVFGAARGLASLEPMLAPGGWMTLAVRSGFDGMLMDADRCCGRWLICLMHSKGAGRTECLVVLLEWMVASDAVVHDGGLDRTLLPTIWTVSRIWRRWGLLSLCPDRIFRLGLAGDGFHGSLVEEDGAPYYGAPRVYCDWCTCSV